MMSAAANEKEEALKLKQEATTTHQEHSDVDDDQLDDQNEGSTVNVDGVNGTGAGAAKKPNKKKKKNNKKKTNTTTDSANADSAVVDSASGIETMTVQAQSSSSSKADVVGNEKGATKLQGPLGNLNLTQESLQEMFNKV
jgi:hypothetical protein